MSKKIDESGKDKFAVMTGHGDGSIVKAWRYYSIFDFCRYSGASREEANETARWCKGAEIGESRKIGDCLIRIMELERSSVWC